MKEIFFNWLSGLGVEVTAMMALVIALSFIVLTALALHLVLHRILLVRLVGLLGNGVDGIDERVRDAVLGQFDHGCDPGVADAQHGTRIRQGTDRLEDVAGLFLRCRDLALRDRGVQHHLTSRERLALLEQIPASELVRDEAQRH